MIRPDHLSVTVTVSRRELFVIFFDEDATIPVAAVACPDWPAVIEVLATIPPTPRHGSTTVEVRTEAALMQRAMIESLPPTITHH